MRGSHEDNGHANITANESFEKLKSRHARHLVIDQNQVDAVVLCREQAQSLLGAIENTNVMIQLLQLQVERFAETGIVVDNRIRAMGCSVSFVL